MAAIPSPNALNTLELPELSPQRESALARLAFGSGSQPSVAGITLSRHLAFLPAADLELDLGDPEQRRFGDYELLEQIGRGGMGVVYRARQHSLDREVAIKLLAAGPWASADFIERFRREAQSAARMQHPNIVAIHEIGQTDELNYFCMRLVQGPSLAQVLSERGTLPGKDAARLLRTVAEALDYAHRLGVLHLDLKPGNVLIDERGEPQVADFGLARRLDESLASDNEELSGTPSYMAPEQAQLRSHKLSPRTDIYGLGAILYECLTGRPPFLGATPQQTIQRVIEIEPVSPHDFVPGLSRDLEAICLKCLAKDPGERYTSARALADDLGRYGDERAVSVRTLNAAQRIVRWARREPRLASAVGIAALTLLLGALVSTQQWLRAEVGAARTRATLWNARLDSAWRDLPVSGAFEIVPAMIANLAEQEAAGATAEAERSRVRLGAVLATVPQLIDVIPGEGAVSATAFAPDGRWVASARATVIAIHELSSGVERCHVDVGAAFGIAWSSSVIAELRPLGDGSRMLAVPSSLSVPQNRWFGTLVDTSDCRLRLPPPERFGDTAHTTYSTDAEYALVRRSAEVDGELLRVSDWSGLTTVRFPPASGNHWSLAPGLAQVLLASVNGTRVELLDPATLAPRHRYVQGAGQTLIASAWTQKGERLALAFDGGDVVLLEPDSGAATVLASEVGALPVSIAFSADDAWLAATFEDGSVRVWDVSSGQAIGPAIRNRAESAHAIPDAIGRTVFVNHHHAAQLWSLVGGEPILLWRRPEPLLNWGRLAPVAWNPEASLLATGSEQGELRLWRVPGNEPVVGRGPPLSMNDAGTEFDGRHIVSVDGANAVVMDLDRTVAAGPVIAYPQTVAFALLASDPPRLISSAGHRLYVHDWRTGMPAYAPIELANTPTLVALAPVTQVILVGYSARQGERNVSVLESYVLATGLRSARVELDGLHRSFGFSNDGQRVLATLAGSVRVLDSTSLAEVWPALQFGPDALAALRIHYAPAGALAPPPGAGANILAGLDRAAGTLWLAIDHAGTLSAGRATAAVAPAGPYELVAVSGQTGRVERSWRMDAAVGSLSALPHDRVALLLRVDRQVMRIVSRDGAMREIAIPDLWGYVGAALSGDGRRLAVGRYYGAVLFDTDSGEWLTPALTTFQAPEDFLSALGLDYSGTALRVRSSNRSWQRYRLPRENRPLAELQRWQELLRNNSLASTTTAGAGIADSERARLRAADPGPALQPLLAPMAPVSIATRVDPEPRFVNLAPACTQQPGDPSWYRMPELGRVLPPGRQRLLGIDFEIGCGVHTSMREVDPTTSKPINLRSRTIPVAMAEVDAIEVLITGRGAYVDRADLPYAIIEFGYRDGSSVRVPILYRRQVWEYWHPPAHGGDARVAYMAMSSREARGGMDFPALYAVRVPNPHPQRDLASLVLEAVDRAGSEPLLLAVTLEPAASTSTDEGP